MLGKRQIAQDLCQGLAPREADRTDVAGIVEDNEAPEHIIDSRSST